MIIFKFCLPGWILFIIINKNNYSYHSWAFTRCQSLGASHVLTHVILTTNIWGKYYYYYHLQIKMLRKREVMDVLVFAFYHCQIHIRHLISSYCINLLVGLLIFSSGIHLYSWFYSVRRNFETLFRERTFTAALFPLYIFVLGILMAASESMRVCHYEQHFQ